MSAIDMEQVRNGTLKAKRVWVDGCFDITHFGHANQLRQCKAVGENLIVGVHSNEEISLHKGTPVFTEEERCRMVKAIKWVDEVVPAAPYITTLETLDKYDCQISVHGDDFSMSADGLDTYSDVKNKNRYFESPRTEGVSTSDLINRILRIGQDEKKKEETPSLGFLPISKLLALFPDPTPVKPTDKVVYVTGSFDLLHVGHLAFLEKAKELGDYLIVGIQDDVIISEKKGADYPIQNVHERALTVLNLKIVDDVVLGVSGVISPNILDQFNVTVVVVGKSASSFGKLDVDPFAVAKQRGIFHEVDSHSDITTNTIVKRVLDNREYYEMRNQLKAEKEKLAAQRLTDA